MLLFFIKSFQAYAKSAKGEKAVSRKKVFLRLLRRIKKEIQINYG